MLDIIFIQSFFHYTFLQTDTPLKAFKNYFNFVFVLNNLPLK